MTTANRSAKSHDVFLSHNSKDKPLVRELAAALERRRLKCWLDENELRPGMPWPPALEKAVKECMAMAVLVGPNGPSPWANSEMYAALKLAADDHRPVIPVLLPGVVAQPELPLFLSMHTWVDLRHGITPDGLQKLHWGITGQKGAAASHAQEGFSDTGSDEPSPSSHHFSFEDLSSGWHTASFGWIDQATIDELLGSTPNTERRRLEELLGKPTERPRLHALVAGLTRCLDPSVRWAAFETRKAFAEVAERVIRSCLRCAAEGCGEHLQSGKGSPVSVAIRTAAFAEILMAGRQSREPNWELKARSKSEDDVTFVVIRGLDLFFSDLEGDRLCEPGPDPKDSASMVERRLYERIFGPVPSYDPHKHRIQLHGELRALADLGHSLYAQVSSNEQRLQWGDVSRDVPGITVLLVTPTSENVIVEEERFAALLRRFYVAVS